MKRNHRDDQPSTSYYNGGRSSSDNYAATATYSDSSKKSKIDSNSPPFSRHSDSNRSNYNSNNNNNNRQLSHLASSNRSNIKDNFLRVTRSIWDHYRENAQSLECFQKKLELKNALYEMFRDIFPYLGVYIVGSSANGFGTNSSDVDVCLMVSHEEINQKTEAVYLLKVLAKAMRKAAFVKRLNVISAKVPIIKFHDSYNEIDCDININNHIGIRNTHLLKAYSDVDYRVRPLILSIKRWAKFHDINDASRQTISSYSLALMAIFYMQRICQPPVVPVLQKIYPEKYNVNTDVRSLRLNEDVSVWTSENIQSLGELFMGFLEFYSNFNFEQNVISVRDGITYSKSKLPLSAIEGQYSPWKYILIEEPFDLSNTARSVFDGLVFRQILNVFQKSYQKLQNTKNFDSLFHEKLTKFDFDESDYFGSHRKF